MGRRGLRTRQQTRNRHKVGVWKLGNRTNHRGDDRCDDKAFRSLGFATYREYLESSIWSAVREMVFDRKGHKCVICDRPATQVHHSRYGMRELIGTRFKHLHPICTACHHEVEFEDGVKVSLVVARARFWRMLDAKSREAANRV